MQDSSDFDFLSGAPRKSRNQRHGFDLSEDVLARGKAKGFMCAPGNAGEQLRSTVSMTDHYDDVHLSVVDRMDILNADRKDIENARSRRAIRRQTDIRGGDPDPARFPLFAHVPRNQ